MLSWIFEFSLITLDFLLEAITLSNPISSLAFSLDAFQGLMFETAQPLCAKTNDLAIVSGLMQALLGIR